MNVFNKNEKIFLFINLVLFAVTFVIYSLKDVSGFVLLFLTILLVNVVCLLAFYNAYKRVKKDVKSLSVIIGSVVLNILTFILIISFIIGII